MLSIKFPEIHSFKRRWGKYRRKWKWSPNGKISHPEQCCVPCNIGILCLRCYLVEYYGKRCVRDTVRPFWIRNSKNKNNKKQEVLVGNQRYPKQNENRVRKHCRGLCRDIIRGKTSFSTVFYRFSHQVSSVGFVDFLTQLLWNPFPHHGLQNISVGKACCRGKTLSDLSWVNLSIHTQIHVWSFWTSN